jgi:hypothetical protein
MKGANQMIASIICYPGAFVNSGYEIQAVPICSALLCAWSSPREPNVFPHCSHLNWLVDDIKSYSSTFNLSITLKVAKF